MSKLNPYEDKLIIKPKEFDQITAGGVILPDTAKEDTMYGEVIAVGPGRYDLNGKVIPMHTKVGDLVVFPKFGPMKFEYEESVYIIARESELLAKIDGTINEDKQLLKG